ncbi:MAG: DNA-formamidopyrimidine glycosylase family protein [Tetrasphaera sp.]
MPEGDTVWRTAHRLDQALGGKPLLTLELRWGELGGRELLPAATLSVASRGKHLLHRLDTGLTVHSHLKLEGSWRIERTATLPPALLHHPDLRALARCATWSALGLRLGLLEIWPTRQEEARLGYLGPDLLGEDWSTERAVSRLQADRPRPIGAALLDQRNLAGIGTFWASEGLHLARLSPWAPVAEFDRATLEHLLTSIRQVMQQAAQTGIQNSTGFTARGRTSYVHGRSGRPCRRCGQPVRVAAIGEGTRRRTMFYCPACQGGRAPTDDGRPQQPLGAARPSATRRRR